MRRGGTEEATDETGATDDPFTDEEAATAAAAVAGLTLMAVEATA